MDFRSEDPSHDFQREDPNDAKTEGVVFPPVPLVRPRVRESVRPGIFLPRDGEPRCELCGSPVIAAHCKRICLRCGFMTSCSEGI